MHTKRGKSAKPVKRAASPKKAAGKGGRKKGSKARGMTESEYVDQLAKATGRAKSEVKRDLELQRDVLAKGLKSRGSVRTPLGTVRAKKVPARPGGKLVRNPFTGEMVKSKPKPATSKVRLTPGRKFKDSL